MATAEKDFPCGRHENAEFVGCSDEIPKLEERPWLMGLTGTYLWLPPIPQLRGITYGYCSSGRAGECDTQGMSFGKWREARTNLWNLEKRLLLNVGWANWLAKGTVQLE